MVVQRWRPLFLLLLPDTPESCPPALRFGRENNPHRRTRSLDSGLPDPPPHQVGGLLDSIGLADSSGEGQGDSFQGTESRKNRTEIHDGKRGPHRGGIGKIHHPVQPLEVLGDPGLVVIGSVLANPYPSRTVTPGIKSRDMGNPIEAIEILGADIAHVHAKDANPPQESGQWGEEVPLGEGSVGMAAFVEALDKAGYCGPLVVEREVGDQQERVAAIKQGISVLRGLA